MAIINGIDCGVYSPWNAPAQTWVGPAWQQLTGSVVVEGDQEIYYPRGGGTRSRTETIWLIPSGSIGGAVAGSQDAVLYLLRQLLELVNNRQLNPCLIQWRSGGGIIVSDSEDGWHIITDIKPNVENIWTGIIPVEITTIYLGPFSTNQIGMAYTGDRLPTDFFLNSVSPLIAFPLGATVFESTFNRVGAEGNIPCITSPVANPSWFVPSGTIANLFKGGVRVFDTINTGTFAVPTVSFVNSGWVEVFGVDHKFIGDCVITNGLIMLFFDAQGVASFYLWNTATSPAAWQKICDIGYVDSSGNVGQTIQAFSLRQVGLEQSSINLIINTSIALASFSIFLKRGQYNVKLIYRSLNDNGAASSGPILVNLPANGPKIVFNADHVADNVNPPNELSASPGQTAGFGAGFIANSAQPFIFGFLYIYVPNLNQPQGYGATNKDISVGDNGVGIDEERTYGIFATPYGIAASYSTANLQGEAESGTLGAGWTSQANAVASNANEAKCASGTTTGNADTWGTAFVPLAGQYDIWVRMKVTSAAGGSNEMQIGWWDNDTSAFVSSTTYKPNQVTTGYLWYKVASLVTPTATKNMRFRAVTVATIGTDWFIDEACAIPRTTSSGANGVNQISDQFFADLSVQMN